MRGRPPARAAHGHCPTCVALHGGRDAGFALVSVAPQAQVLQCPNCGRTWAPIRGGFKRADPSQEQMAL